jgi:hypothetical protein
LESIRWSQVYQAVSEFDYLVAFMESLGI